MMKRKEFLEYFQFSRKERVAIVSLLVLIAGVFVLPHLGEPKESNWDITVHSFVDSTTSEISPAISTATGKNSGKPKASFVFDPNLLADAGWRALGLSERKVGTIRRYLNKGGRFYKPADIGKIYGLTNEEIEHLVPLVRIAGSVKEQSHAATGYPEKRILSESRKENRLPQSVQLNSADTAQLIALPGIGSKLATRIVNFRNKLGGFFSVDQVSETYGLPDSTFRKIKHLLECDPAMVQQLDLNSATKVELQQHPYIRYEVANAILQYRKQHGRFDSIEDLKKIMIVDSALLLKIRPYLKVD